MEESAWVRWRRRWRRLNEAGFRCTRSIDRPTLVHDGTHDDTSLAAGAACSPHRRVCHPPRSSSPASAPATPPERPGVTSNARASERGGEQLPAANESCFFPVSRLDRVELSRLLLTTNRGERATGRDTSLIRANSDGRSEGMRFSTGAMKSDAENAG